jgi:hypothetical protein
VPLRCRLTSLSSAVDGEAALAAMRDGLDRHLRKGETFLDQAESRCGAGRKGPARRSLRMMRRRLARIGKAMHAKPVRRTIAPAVTDPIMRAAAGLASDARTFAGRLTCP